MPETLSEVALIYVCHNLPQDAPTLVVKYGSSTGSDCQGLPAGQFNGERFIKRISIECCVGLPMQELIPDLPFGMKVHDNPIAEVGCKALGDESA